MKILNYALGFTQVIYRRHGVEFASFIFSPRIHVVEWNAGNIYFGAKTYDVFIKRYRKMFSLDPVFSRSCISSEPLEKGCLPVYPLV